MASYRKGHIKSKIHRIKPQKLIFLRLWFWVGFLLLIFICCGIYFLLFFDGIQVKNIVIYGNEKILNNDLEALVSRDVKHKILGIGSWELNSKSMFLVNESKIRKNLLEKFLEIESCLISKNFPQTLVLEIKERNSLGVFCAQAAGSQSKEIDYECFLIDYGGVIFESVEKIFDDTLIVRQSGEVGKASLGEKVVDQGKIGAIYKIQKNLNDNFKIVVREAVIAGPERLNIKTNDGWEAYFDLNESFDNGSQLTKLDLLLSGELTPEQRANLRYIDLRPKDRAIVCDNDECGQ